MQENFNLSRNINTICLPEEENIAELVSMDNCIATGWGKDKFGIEGSYQTILKQIKMSMVDHDTCEANLRNTTRLGEFFVLDDSFNCAGGMADVDLCTGDGGGPLVCPSKINPKTWIQVISKYFMISLSTLYMQGSKDTGLRG